MNTNFEVKLIGYYVVSPMNPEKRFVEECEQLAKLFNESFTKTFNSVEMDNFDTEFKKSLTENSVYIFTDKEKNKFAYRPSKNSVRITNVRICKDDIVFAPTFIKSWFLLGEKIDLDFNAKPQQDNRISQKGADFYNLKNEKTNYKRFRVQPMGADIIVTFENHSSYPIDFEETIPMKELYDLINSDYIYLQLYDVKDDCDDCDSYSYSNCDYSRCKGDCEDCGGRKYICNNNCFNYRHKYAVRLMLYTNFHDDASGLQKTIIDKISTSHIVNTMSAQEKDEWCHLLDKVYEYNRVNALITKFRDSIYCGNSYISISNELNDYTLVYNCLWNHNEIEKVEIIFDSDKYLFQTNQVHVDSSSFLLFWDHRLNFNFRSFDFIQKQFISINKSFKIKKASSYEDLIRKGGLKRIVLKKDKKTYICELS